MMTRIREWWILKFGSMVAKASLWVARCERGLSSEEQVELDKWLSKDSRHEEALFETQIIWQGMDALNGGVSRVPSGWSDRSSDAVNSKWIYWTGGIAASLVLGLTIWLLEIKVEEEAIEPSAIVIDAPGYKRQVLDDGSTIELKPGTQLTIAYTKSERLIHLHEGEGFFTVAKDPNRPFVVKSRFGVVTAVGTAFTVKLAGVLSEVWVTEGRVKVSKPVSLFEEEQKSAQHETEVVAGRMMIKHISDDGYQAKVVSVSEEEIEVQLEWKDRILQFVSAPLYEIVAEFNRLNNIKIILMNDELKTTRLTIAMEPDNYRDFARMLELSLNAQIEYGDDIIFVSSE